MKLLFTSLLFLLVASCSILPKTKPSAAHDFGFTYLSTTSEITAQKQQSPITVEAPKWLVDNRIHYRLLYSNPTQVRFYALDRWIAPPSELFEQLLNSSSKHWVVPAIIRLNIFEQQFVSSTQAKVAMHFTVTTVPDDKNHKPKKQSFHLQLPCPTPDAKGAVTGFTALTKEAGEKVEAWLMETN
jgi:cholesterol transport system auxiliary component